MKKDNKKIIKNEVKKFLQTIDMDDRDVDHLIDELQEIKKECKKDGFFKFFTECEATYDYSSEYGIYGVRLETDEEFEKRVERNKKQKASAKKAAKKREENKKAKDLETYKKLHKQYKGKIQ